MCVSIASLGGVCSVHLRTWDCHVVDYSVYTKCVIRSCLVVRSKLLIVTGDFILPYFFQYISETLSYNCRV